jgi:hypothetical protein
MLNSSASSPFPQLTVLSSLFPSRFSAHSFTLTLNSNSIYSLEFFIASGVRARQQHARPTHINSLQIPLNFRRLKFQWLWAIKLQKLRGDINEDVGRLSQQSLVRFDGV